jgi:phosphatidate phosphatase LPIN
MQYVRSISGSVSKTWNSINPATLSGAIDVIVIEQENGVLACSPFHVRFGKFSLLRPYEKKVEFKVNGVKQPYAMKLGEGGEAFFVFETSAVVPEGLQTSPVISPASSPANFTSGQPTPTGLTLEPTYLDITDDQRHSNSNTPTPTGSPRRPTTIREESGISENGSLGEPFVAAPSRAATFDTSVSAIPIGAENTSTTSLPVESLPGRTLGLPIQFTRSASEELVPTTSREQLNALDQHVSDAENEHSGDHRASLRPVAPASPSSLSPKGALDRAHTLAKKLSTSNIRSHITETGDLMLDMQGYKGDETDLLRAEKIARQLLSEEIEGHYDIGSLIGMDENRNLWVYSSEEAKEAASKKMNPQANILDSAPPVANVVNDTASDPGYHSDSDRSPSPQLSGHHRAKSEEPGQSMNMLGDSSRNFAKTLRLTSDQLKALKLKPGANTMSFTVNRSTCTGHLYLWTHDVPIVISDIDGTITKSDALGHLLTMVGRDWTHLGVAKLYSDIVANGYNIFYLTSRSVGQADTTRAYLKGISQEGWKLPSGPVILSPDRTMAALRREVYLRKPEMFKMACLQDIQSLFPDREKPFYAGFGNRLTDALSYRTVHIPSSRIFTINSNAEVAVDLVQLSKYKSNYTNMREVVDIFFPPISTLVKEGGEDHTDFTEWRNPTLEVDHSFSDDDDDEDYVGTIDDRSEVGDMGDSYLSRDSVDESTLAESLRDSLDLQGSVEVRAERSRSADQDFQNDYLGGDGSEEPEES